jgi:hypothetical protein
MSVLLRPVIGVGTLFLVALIWSRIRPGVSYPVNRRKSA